MRLSIYFCILLEAFLVRFSSAQESGENHRIVFHNTENLYDPFDDSTQTIAAVPFLGFNTWNYFRFQKKILNIYKIVMAAGELSPPDMVGLCEVENRFVLNQLVYNTPLKQFQYGIVHYQSPDRRGIDVALIYRKQNFRILTEQAFGIYFPADTSWRTRDILYVKGIIAEKDTLHLFVNHFPSKLGGSLASEAKRNFVASVLRQKIDSLFLENSSSNIILMGDFNDEPESRCLKEIVKARTDSVGGIDPDELFNLSAALKKNSGIGTHKYRGRWSVIDQFMVSRNMVGNSTIKAAKAGIFAPGFLLEDDPSGLGKKPFRSYSGYRYAGGYSDHLPVYLDLVVK
jgi:endonuclease/exonuclease/phosphatase family metal-dependent hydrolase